MFGKKNGFIFVNVVLNTDKRTNQPNGSAICDIAEVIGDGLDSTDISTLVNKLHGQFCGGRPIRIFNRSNGADRRGKDNARYFGIDISKKCVSCGEVGHKVNDCTNKPIPTPCHLCAGKDHEAGSRNNYE